MASNFTVLIQGPYRPRLQVLGGHKNYTTFGPVVISCYTDDDTSALDQEDGITVVKNPIPNDSEISIPCVHPYPMYPDMARITGYHQLYSTYNGLKNITTDYVVKTRSDEFYEDLNPFINKFLENDNCIVCGSIYLRAWNAITHHFGDHLFIVKTDVLKNATKKLLDMYTVLPKDRSEQEKATAKYKAIKLALDKKAKEIESAGEHIAQKDINEYKELKEAVDKLGSCPCDKCEPDNPWGADTIEILEDWAMPTLHRPEARWHLNFENVLFKSMLLAMDVPHSKLNCRKTVKQHLKILDLSHARNFITHSNYLGSTVGYDSDNKEIPTHDLFSKYNDPDHGCPELEQVKNPLLEKISLPNSIAGMQIRHE